MFIILTLLIECRGELLSVSPLLKFIAFDPDILEGLALSFLRFTRADYPDFSEEFRLMNEKNC